MEHERGEGQPVISREGRSQPLIIACQSTESRGPGKGAFHHPTPRQEHKAVPGLMMLNDFQWQSFLSGIACRLLSGVALIDKSHLHILSAHLLNRLSQSRYLRPILFVGWRYFQGQ